MTAHGPRMPRRRRRAAGRRPRAARTARRWFWPSFVGFAVAAVVALIVALQFTEGGSSDGPLITAPPDQPPLRVGALAVSPARFDLGDVPLNKWVRPTFELRNVGDKPVTVTVSGWGIKTLEGC